MTNQPLSAPSEDAPQPIPNIVERLGDASLDELVAWIRHPYVGLTALSRGVYERLLAALARVEQERDAARRERNEAMGSKTAADAWVAGFRAACGQPATPVHGGNHDLPFGSSLENLSYQMGREEAKELLDVFARRTDKAQAERDSAQAQIALLRGALDANAERLREARTHAFEAGITAVYTWGEEGEGKRWIFEEDCLHPSAKAEALAAYLASLDTPETGKDQP